MNSMCQTQKMLVREDLGSQIDPLPDEDPRRTRIGRL
jgi:hypothetical protein